MMSATSSRNRSPFTQNQWQELEQQALVFKYMVTGTPIPQDLIFSIKRSLDTSMSSRIFPHPPIGWGCYEMGFGRKVDPEPGRCRRTDGKKWRCSKEAYPDSKYCERHMHRGRNRSRKPVELVVVSSSTTTSQINTPTTPSSAFSFSSNMASHDHSQSQQPFSQSYPYFYNSHSNKPLDSHFQSQDASTHHMFLDSSSFSHDNKDYRRHVDGTRDGVDERSFFPEATGSSSSCYHNDSYQQQQLSVDSFKSSYSSSQQFQNNMNDDNQRQHQQEQHCFVLGTDFKSTTRPTTNKDTKESGTGSQKPLTHHFFGDQWTTKNTDSWLDLSSNSTIPTDE